MVSKDGKSFSRDSRKTSNSIGSSDCYMIKSGDIELLVDGGYQTMTSSGNISSSYTYNDTFVKKNCANNLLKKIASVISKDGILDYLIVTHADYDHIASLIVDGGILDAFLNQRTITDLNGNKVKFTRINYIIDFDSGLVKKFSNVGLTKELRLVRSDAYQCYVKLREKLIKVGTSYCPASAFFDNANLQSQDVTISDANRALGISDKVAERVKKAELNGVTNCLYSEEYKNGITSDEDSSYKDETIFTPEVGNIVSVDLADNSARYYYSLKFNKSELRILYNWHYDYIFHSSFNQNQKGDDGDSTQRQDPIGNIYDSQDANNISVCFEIVSAKFKLLSMGDLGGNGENGLLKYYDGTNVLSNISIYKASHHGSTTNGENSSELFKTIKPNVIVITGCSSYKDANWCDNGDDPVMSALVSRTRVKQDFFSNVLKNYSSKENQPYIFCTNITSCVTTNGITGFQSVPFYGDIRIRFNDDKLCLAYSYVGDIAAYKSKDWNADYFQNNKKEYSFKTRESNKILSFQNCDWFKTLEYTMEDKK